MKKQINRISTRLHLVRLLFIYSLMGKEEQKKAVKHLLSLSEDDFEKFSPLPRGNFDKLPSYTDLKGTLFLMTDEKEFDFSVLLILSMYPKKFNFMQKMFMLERTGIESAHLLKHHLIKEEVTLSMLDLFYSVTEGTIIDSYVREVFNHHANRLGWETQL